MKIGIAIADYYPEISKNLKILTILSFAGYALIQCITVTLLLPLLFNFITACFISLKDAIPVERKIFFLKILSDLPFAAFSIRKIF